MDKDLIKLLEQTGFTQKEAEVYLALLELGRGIVTEVAKLTKLKRSIIYVILEGLLKRGYVNEVPGCKINTYQATDPSLILSQLRGVTQNFSQMLPILRTLGNKGKKKPKIHYYDTKDGVINIWNEINFAEKAFFITSYQRINEHFPGIIYEWIEKGKKKIIRGDFKHLISDNPFELDFAKKILEVRHSVRILPELKNSHMDFTIYDNKLALASLAEEPFIVVIESEELVKSIRPLFEMAWDNGKEVV